LKRREKKVTKRDFVWKNRAGNESGIRAGMMLKHMCHPGFCRSGVTGPAVYKEGTGEARREETRRASWRTPRTTHHENSVKRHEKSEKCGADSRKAAVLSRHSPENWTILYNIFCEYVKKTYTQLLSEDKNLSDELREKIKQNHGWGRGFH